MKIQTGEIDSEKGSVTRPKKMGVPRQDQFNFNAYRVMDTVIMGNAGSWEALRGRETLYAREPNALTDEDGFDTMVARRYRRPIRASKRQVT